MAEAQEGGEEQFDGGVAWHFHEAVVFAVGLEDANRVPFDEQHIWDKQFERLRSLYTESFQYLLVPDGIFPEVAVEHF